MKKSFLRRLLVITRSFNLALWVTTLCVGMVSLLVLPKINDLYLYDTNIWEYIKNIFIAAIIMMIIFFIILIVVYAILGAINRLVKTLINKKRPH